MERRRVSFLPWCFFPLRSCFFQVNFPAQPWDPPVRMRLSPSSLQPRARRARPCHCGMNRQQELGVGGGPELQALSPVASVASPPPSGHHVECTPCSPGMRSPQITAPLSLLQHLGQLASVAPRALATARGLPFSRSLPLLPAHVSSYLNASVHVLLTLFLFPPLCFPSFSSFSSTSSSPPPPASSSSEAPNFSSEGNYCRVLNLETIVLSPPRIL